ncbi:MAG: thiamine pyrophosphate-dependent dehydrogenase E1 component subunit alpha [Chloroflexi bacterium]|nr:thiamine pyrophosphate-dependent dehydrogenase E1 component subunit alpha [Chloroflexota bacterium]
MYRQMLLMRLVGERMMQLNRMGRVAFSAASDGHEAAEVGAGWAIQRGKDWCVPYYRDLGVAIVLGLSTVDEFRGVFAKATDPTSGGRQLLNQFSSVENRILSGSVNIATQFPHAVGLALAAKIKKEDHIVFVFGGEAATSPGDWHESMNFASVHKLPVVFVIENNLLAISTTFEQQMAVKNVADRAAAYAMPGLIADGMDVLDSFEKVKEAAARARAGRGPSLVELKCYRYLPHTSDDDDSKYRSKETLAYWRARDPIDKGRAYLTEQGVSAVWFDEVRASVVAEIEQAIDQAESEPDPRPEDAARHVYAEDRPLPRGTRA